MERTYDDTMFRDTFEHEYTWLNGFLRNVERYGDRLALIDPATDRSWTYEELNKEANRFAQALAADGLGKNSIVTAFLLNTPEFAFCYVGPRKIGAILHAANFNLAAGEMALLIDHNHSDVVIYSAEVADTVEKALQLATHQPRRVIIADNLDGAPAPAGHTPYEDYVAGQPTENPIQPVRPHIYDEVLRLCTSGTTALPKSVPLNDINEVLSAHDVIMQYPMNCHDITLNMTPWFHRGGCHCGGPGPAFYVGATIIVLRHFTPKAALSLTERFRITFLMGAPATLEMLSRTQQRTPYDLSSLRGLVTMGAPFDREACIRYQEVLTPNIFNGYGTTETFWNSFLRPYDLPEYAGSVGGSCIDDDVRLVRIYQDHKADPDEEVACDSEEVGEVIIRSPAKTTYSYIDDPAQQEAKFSQGWMYTGDIGIWNERRYITILGRKDDMIVVAAENVYPTQVEAVINGHERVADSCVIGVANQSHGQVIAAYIEAADDALTIDEVAQFVAESPMLSKYKQPRYYRIVEALPRTATGKKRANVVREMAADDLEAGLLKRPRLGG